ncbi:MAG: hypothetical protein ACREVZ_08420, partial [Burkholderiales bacterium]
MVGQEQAAFEAQGWQIKDCAVVSSDPFHDSILKGFEGLAGSRTEVRPTVPAHGPTYDTANGIRNCRNVYKASGSSTYTPMISTGRQGVTLYCP